MHGSRLYVEALADLGCLERIGLDENGKQVYWKIRNPSAIEAAAIRMALSRGARS